MDEDLFVFQTALTLVRRCRDNWDYPGITDEERNARIWVLKACCDIAEEHGDIHSHCS